LAQKPESITLGQVVRLFEGHTDLVECVSRPEKCTMADDYQVRLAWRKAIRSLFEKLDAITIADLISKNPGRNRDGR
jgi:DNA-binding IscR family transcriptional regulator